MARNVYYVLMPELPLRSMESDTLDYATKNAAIHSYTPSPPCSFPAPFLPLTRLLQTLRLDCTISSATARSLNRVQHPAEPVLDQIRDIPNRISVREQVPAAGAIAVVVKP